MQDKGLQFREFPLDPLDSFDQGAGFDRVSRNGSYAQQVAANHEMVRHIAKRIGVYRVRRPVRVEVKGIYSIADYEFLCVDRYSSKIQAARDDPVEGKLAYVRLAS